MKEQYISISEFARRAGVSHQAIYKRLDKDLQPWLQVADGKKSLNIKALELFEVEKSATDSTESATIKLLQRTVDMLEKELDLKNKEIEALHARLAESHTLIDNQQRLQAATTKQSLLPDQPATAPVEVVTVTEAVPEPIQDAAPSAAAAPEQDKPKKKSFWDRLFG